MQNRYSGLVAMRNTSRRAMRNIRLWTVLFIVCYFSMMARNLGRKSLEEVINKLAMMGLHLADEENN